jgi:hypothetical protein
MGIKLLLYNTEGSVVDQILFAGFEDHQSLQSIMDVYLTQDMTPTLLMTLTEELSHLIGQYHMDAPVFPVEALLDLTPELGDEWPAIVEVARAQYLVDWGEFEEQFDTIRGIITDGIEYTHTIPFEKHRIQDILGDFQQRYDDCCYISPSGDDMSVCEYEYIEGRITLLRQAAMNGLTGMWVY